MSDPTDLFAGFASRRVAAGRGEMFVRTGGSSPPLLLLHGYPQTHVCWHKVAPRLAEVASLVIPDLPGYGASFCPVPDPGHHAHSKRALGEDMLALMAALGHRRFAVMGHDRGARIAYRMALDHSQRITAAILLDILPTIVVWEQMNAASARASYHWPFLAQPHPLPETLIAADPAYYVAHTLASWSKTRDLSPFAPGALAHYRAMLQAPERIRAVCEDYRAGATVDRDLDAADRAQGRRIQCPTLVLWGSDYVGKGTADPLAVWRHWCTSVTGAAIDSAHFLVEEAPDAVLDAVLPFLQATPALDA